LPESLVNFSRRVAQILSADWCGVVVFSAGLSELHSATPARDAGLDAAELLARATEATREKESRQAIDASSSAVRAAKLFVIPVRASNGEALGAICVYGAPPEVVKREAKLVRALANHAALSLENFLRFSQLERSKRQWVQDIDAISDYIVVHDRSWKIVRTNRSLADHLGVPPVALVGEAVSTLRTLAEGDR